MTHFGCRNIELFQGFGKLLRMVNVRQEIDNWDQLAIVQSSPDEACVIVATLFAIGDHIYSGSALRFHCQPHAIVRSFLKILFAEPSLKKFVQRLDQPAWSWPAADSHHG